MSEQRHEEKELQKQEEKREEKAPQEKNWDEKYRRDPVNVVVWAAILIWAGLVLLAENLGLFGMLAREGSDAPWSFLTTTGAGGIIIFIGAGVILLAGVAYRLAARRRPVRGAIILAVIFIAIGLGDLVKWDVVWPIVLVAVGLAIVAGALTRRGKG